MKITYLGTGAAEGVPAMFCACPFCTGLRKSGDKREFRTRSQVIIDGGLSIDFPPEAYVHSIAYGADFSALKNILVTHSHMDHFYAHDFILRGYKYATLGNEKLTIYGNAEVSKVFAECTRREIKQEVLVNIEMKEVGAFESFETDGYRILTLPAQHGTAEEALLYYVEKGGKGYLHLCDTGALADSAIEFLQKSGAHVNLITFDCTFLDAPPREGTRHMCIADNLNIKNRLDKAGITDAQTRCVITHFSHNAKPSKERLALTEQKYPVTAAYDGLTLEV